MTGVGSYLAILALSIKWLNHNSDDLGGWKDKRPKYFMPMKTHITNTETSTLKVKDWKKIYHANGNQNKQEYLYSYQIKQTKLKTTKRKKTHFVVMKGLI